MTFQPIPFEFPYNEENFIFFISAFGDVEYENIQLKQNIWGRLILYMRKNVYSYGRLFSVIHYNSIRDFAKITYKF